ncbi:MAG: nickel-dependent lactate racemase, partial [Nitrosopumilaceae archaeon]
MPIIKNTALNTKISNFYHTKAFAYNIIGLKMTSFKIPYGKKVISFEIPSEFKVTVAKSNSVTPINNISKSTKNALLNPINSKRLSELIKKDDSVCIIVTDITRASPDKEILPQLIEQIIEKTSPKNLKFLIATGLHREMSNAEKIEKYGAKIVKNFQIIDHDAKNEKNLISLGTTKNGTPIKISKAAYDSDFLISIGVVEPHQYAGYSGGYKTLAIGVAGDETISKTHSRMFIEHQKTRIGNIDGNIFNEDISEIGKKAGLDFIVNVILDDEKNIVDIKAGEPLETYKSLVSNAKKISETQLSKSFDVAICGIGFPKDTNLYQTSRAASYLFYLPT